jgi:hypothetical protein
MRVCVCRGGRGRGGGYQCALGVLRDEKETSVSG